MKAWDRFQYDGGPPMGWLEEFSLRLSETLSVRVVTSAIGNPVEWFVANTVGTLSFPLCNGTASSVENGKALGVAAARAVLNSALEALDEAEAP